MKHKWTQRSVDERIKNNENATEEEEDEGIEKLSTRNWD